VDWRGQVGGGGGSRIERVPNLSARDNQRLARVCDDGLSSGPRGGIELGAFGLRRSMRRSRRDGLRRGLGIARGRGEQIAAGFARGRLRGFRRSGLRTAEGFAGLRIAAFGGLRTGGRAVFGRAVCGEVCGGRTGGGGGGGSLQ
jgi:hypothetical protein